jgi:uncharacterized protein (DUF433 family)
MATVAKVTYPHIVKEPGYCGGRAAIDNTRIRVSNVVFLHEQGKTPSEILVEYPSLSLAQIHAALTYYYDHKEEIEAEFAEGERVFQQMDRDWREHVARHGGNLPDTPSPEDRRIAKPFLWPPKK